MDRVNLYFSPHGVGTSCGPLFLAVGLVVAPHFLHLPLGVPIAFYVIMAWAGSIQHRGAPVVAAWLRALLVMGALTAVLLYFGTIFGRNAGASMLVLLTGLKLLELKGPRDAMVVLFLGYFLLVTNFLFSQSMAMVAYLLPITLLLVATQVRSTRTEGASSLRADVRLAAVLLAQAVPMVVLLFVLFPRFEGPLWGLPKDAYSGMTGLSESMEPGNITQLAQSDEVAFRVRFQGSVPPMDRLYWRGLVLAQTDGRGWSAGSVPWPPAQLDVSGDPVVYRVTLEPHNRRWLFALEMPASAPPNSHLSATYQLVAGEPVRSRMQYRAKSYLSYTFFGLTPEMERRNLQLPDDGGNARTLALARSWRATADPEQRVRLALRYFRTQPFYYTLTPPALSKQDAIDQFLFDTRRGYCEHYAGAFTYLMRAAGVPARVVVGYQGGEFNPLGGYLIVRQLNAHAWTEVWLDERGWTRVDPTAVLPAERIELPADTLSDRFDLAQRLGLPAPGAVLRLLRNVRRALDAVNNNWNEWVLGYGRDKQYELLSRLGLDPEAWSRIGILLVGGVAGVLLLVALRMLWLMPDRTDPVVLDYRRFCRRLARHGLVRGPSEGPWSFLARVEHLRPQCAAQARLITRLYVALRYGAPGGLSATEDWPKRLHRMVRRFRG